MSSKLKAITKGSQIIDQIFWELLKTLKSGKPLTEIMLEKQIRKLSKQLGGDGVAFEPTMVSFGRNASQIHRKPNNTKIGKNNFLMLDFGVKVSGYCSDFTRTLFIGKPTKYQEKIYNIVLNAQKMAIKKIAIGKFGDEIDFAARHIINQNGFGKFYQHGTGHGVTKKIHDLPSFKPNSGDIVKNGDVVTIEPGIYLPGKFGIRIEDMVYVSKKPKIFSRIPKDFKRMVI